MQLIGKYLILIGLLTACIGFILWMGGEFTAWFGHLPGDIHIKKEKINIYFPLSSCLLLSLLISLIIWLLRKFL